MPQLLEASRVSDSTSSALQHKSRCKLKALSILCYRVSKVLIPAARLSPYLYPNLSKLLLSKTNHTAHEQALDSR